MYLFESHFTDKAMQHYHITQNHREYQGGDDYTTGREKHDL